MALYVKGSKSSDGAVNDYVTGTFDGDDDEAVKAQLEITILEDYKRKLAARAPVLTHLNADTSWLLSVPVPLEVDSEQPDYSALDAKVHFAFTSGLPKLSNHDRAGGGATPSPDGCDGMKRQYYHILIDPWLSGSQSDVAAFFSQQWHANESAIPSIAKLQEHIWGLERSAALVAIRYKLPGAEEDDARQRVNRARDPPPNTNLIDAILISHEFTDHMHRETLLEVPSHVPVFAGDKAASIIRSWKHFDTVHPLPIFGSDSSSSERNYDWRTTSRSPLPPWIGLSRLPADKKDLLNYHSALLIAFQNNPQTPTAQAIIYTPHGLPPTSLPPLTTATPPIETLALLHGLHSITLTRGAQLNLGAHNGLKVPDKKGGGIVSWFLRRKELSVRDALEAEIRERREEGEERHGEELERVRFVECGNGEVLFLE
jgi:hypothetical protein